MRKSRGGKVLPRQSAMPWTGLKLCAGCADALTAAAAAANPESTPMCAICGINPPATEGTLERRYRDYYPELAAAAARVESLNLCDDCGMVAASLGVAMQSDQAPILARPVAVAINWLSKLAANPVDSHCADCTALGMHLSLPDAGCRRDDGKCMLCRAKIVPTPPIAALPPGVTAPGEVHAFGRKVGLTTS